MQNLWVNLSPESPNYWVIFFKHIKLSKTDPSEIQQKWVIFDFSRL